ncbi:MAG: C40 family peptidase [Nitrospira sp.]|nr:C40 family peptidase [Nitrospira sp.]MBS0153116.1 C40 family peptidase [Nitrospira sp.]MBS0167173.1 C40 family peptidase [Nitrospira sp.]
MNLPLFRSCCTIGLLTLLLAGTFSGCAANARQSAASDRTMIPTTGTRGMLCCAMAKGMPGQTALAKTAVRFVGQSRIQIGGRNYNPDCSGFVRGVYASQRVDLYSGLGELDGGNGVGRIYTHVVEHGRIHYGPTIHPGDLVFFHNTWDFNGDGVPNDPLTHIGVVEKVEPDGTVLFVSSLSRGIERYRMNLRYPDIHKTTDGRVFNDFLRRKRFGDGMGTHYLAGQLFAAFGTLSH